MSGIKVENWPQFLRTNFVSEDHSPEPNAPETHMGTQWSPTGSARAALCSDPPQSNTSA